MSNRIILIVVATISVIAGTVTALSGAGIMAVFGRERTLQASESVSTPTRALVVGAGDLTRADGTGGLSRAPVISLSAIPHAAGQEVFIGVGPAAAVDRYLAGASIDVVTDFEIAPVRLSTVRQEGHAVPGAPGSQSFWVARGQTGSGSAELAWKVQSGQYRVVIMNIDASPGVDVEAQFGVRLPAMMSASVMVLLIGVAFGLGGVALLVLGLRSRSEPPSSGAAPIGSRTPSPERPVDLPARSRT